MRTDTGVLTPVVWIPRRCDILTALRPGPLRPESAGTGSDEMRDYHVRVTPDNSCSP